MGNFKEAASTLALNPLTGAAASLVAVQFNQWTVVSLDRAVALELKGQYQPTGGAEDNAAPSLAETSTVGSERPTVQWVAGGRRVVKFRSSFVSLHELHDIRPLRDALEALGRRDASLGRAPRVVFTWGDIVVEGFAKVRKRIEGWWPITGWPTRVDFELDITEALELDLDGSGSSSSGETQYRTLADGEILETLGAAYLGDPLRGELIRRENPLIAAGETAGDRVKVLERTHPAMRGTVRPSSPPFLGLEDTGTVAELLTDLASDRGTTTRGLTWSRLPEVLAGEV